METENPYQAPAAAQVFGEQAPAGDGEVWRDGPLLVVRRGGTLPDRCVKCNQSADGLRFKRTVGASILAPGPMVPIEFCLCRSHLFRARRAAAIPILGLAFGCFITFWYAGSPEFLLGPATILLSPIVGVWKLRSRTLFARKISSEYIWLAGAHPEYLAELPEIPVSEGDGV